MIVFSLGGKRMCVIIIVSVSTNLRCCGYLWYIQILLMGNCSDATIVSAIMLWCEQRVWWYKKFTVGRWVCTFFLDVLVDTTKTLAHGECLTISQKIEKWAKILYLKKMNKYIYTFIYIGFFFDPDVLKAIKTLLPNPWAFFRCKNGNLNSKKNTKN